MTDTFDTYSTFRPFGDGVRIGSYGAAGDTEISANLFDLCERYGVDHEQAKRLQYPDGSILILQIEQGSIETEIYLSEEAYPVFMTWVAEVQT